MMTRQPTREEVELAGIYRQKKPKTTLEEVLLYEAGYNTANAEIEEKIEKIMNELENIMFVTSPNHEDSIVVYIEDVEKILKKHLSPKEKDD